MYGSDSDDLDSVLCLYTCQHLFLWGGMFLLRLLHTLCVGWACVTDLSPDLLLSEIKTTIGIVLTFKEGYVCSTRQEPCIKVNKDNTCIVLF